MKCDRFVRQRQNGRRITIEGPTPIRTTPRKNHPWRKWSVRAVLAALAILALSYVFLPGGHRGLTPTLFGVSKVEAGLYIDDPQHAQKAQTLLSEARRTSAAFFGPQIGNPWFIICTTPDCDARFGVKTRGLAYGRYMVLISSRGFFQTIITHEQTHLDLHRYLTLSDLFDPTFPIWFNEGLASLLSQDQRLILGPAETARWIMKTRTLQDWGRLHQDQDWRETYGAAMSVVLAMDAELGRNGLRDFVVTVGEGADFEAELQKRLGADWP